jgi:hypothetical protein
MDETTNRKEIVMKVGVIDERGGDNSKISHILFKEIERLYNVEEKYNEMKIGKTKGELNEEVEKLSKELKTYLNLSEKTIAMNIDLSGYNRRLKRACGNALAFFENYRLSHLHEMDEKEIKLSHQYLQEMQEVLDEEESFIKDSN